MAHISTSMNDPLLALPGDYQASVLDGDRDGDSDAAVLRFEGNDGHSYGAVAVSRLDAQAPPGSDAWGEGTLFVFSDRSESKVLGMYLVDASGQAVPQDYLDGGKVRSSAPLQTERSEQYGGQVVASTFKFPDGTKAVMKTVDRDDPQGHLNGTQLTLSKPSSPGSAPSEIGFFSEGILYDEDLVYPATFSVGDTEHRGAHYQYAFFESAADPQWPQAFPQEQLHPRPTTDPAPGWRDTVKSWLD